MTDAVCAIVRDRERMTSRADRERHVAQMLANHRIEGYEPDEADRQLQAAYIDGTASSDDLLAHARQSARGGGGLRDAWFRAQVQEAIDDPRPSIPHDQVMADARPDRAEASAITRYRGSD
jgi:hypothetical protein